ncbi:MAG: hypothetical protein FWF81_06565 [Defluviitaleaceae bacterium]|nr:hypothetical protein [Defluviitaleaceae bacterium]
MPSSNVYGGQFFNIDEYEVCSIGTGYMANYVSGGGANRAGATLTNKRVYFSGHVFTIKDNGAPVALKQRKVVNIRDITGIGYLFYNPIEWLVYAAIAAITGIGLSITMDGGASIGGLLLGLVVGGGLAAVWYMGRMTLFAIEYAGGSIAFDVRWIQSHEQDDFIRNIHLSKDALYGVSAAAQGFVLC